MVNNNRRPSPHSRAAPGSPFIATNELYQSSNAPIRITRAPDYVCIIMPHVGAAKSRNRCQACVQADNCHCWKHRSRLFFVDNGVRTAQFHLRNCVCTNCLALTRFCSTFDDVRNLVILTGWWVTFTIQSETGVDKSNGASRRIKSLTVFRCASINSVD